MQLTNPIKIEIFNNLMTQRYLVSFLLRLYLCILDVHVKIRTLIRENVANFQRIFETQIF